MINLITLKKLLIIFLLFFIVQITKAQSYYDDFHPLNNNQKSPDYLQYRNRWNVKVGAGLGTTWRYKKNFMDVTALSLSAEPSYRLTNYIALGLRGEYTFMKSYLSGTRIKASPIGSISLTGDVIKLWKHGNAPFIGLGAGAYFLGHGELVSKTSSGETIQKDKRNLGTRFGISPRIGINIRSFSVAIELHLIEEKVFNNRDYVNLKFTYSL